MKILESKKFVLGGSIAAIILAAILTQFHLPSAMILFAGGAVMFMSALGED